MGLVKGVGGEGCCGWMGGIEGNDKLMLVCKQ